MTSTRQTNTGSRTILLVDDERYILHFMKAAFRMTNHRLREASDGAAALEVLTQNQGEIDLIVTDVHMPRLNGIALVTKAREIAPDIKVVVASGGVDYDERKKISELGVNAFLQKPFSAKEMLACVDLILNPAGLC